MIDITEQAKEYLLKTNKGNLPFFFLGLKESGCSGFSYLMKWCSGQEDEVKEEFVIPESIRHIDIKGVALALPVRDLPRLAGSVIDLERQGLNRNIIVKNPHVQNSCGCGSSMSFDQ